ncbi:MAG: hypothetical protein M3Q69_00785 [Acidobacteriota bacterium]|nr:hypothetical protein [Acidobacteriota bacterium]
MTQSGSVSAPAQPQAVKVVFVLLLFIAVPAFLTLHTVKVPSTPEFPAGVETSPYGYTVSLLLWIVPIVGFGYWLIPKEHLKIPRRAFWITALLTFGIGVMLDFLFAQYFFEFPNAGATLRIKAPALGAPVPIEEYIFYITGAIVVLLLYIWFDESFLSAYHSGTGIPGKLLQFHWPSVVTGLVLIAAAYVYKNFFTDSPGFPGYFTFLTLLAIVPSAGFLRAASPLINWRAFSATLFFVVLVSLLWEATLGVPYGWWAYEPNAMVGIFVRAWSNLPIEAVLLWGAATFTSVILFTVIKAWVASDRTLKGAFLGK